MAKQGQPPPRPLPNRIRELREERGWSERELGERCIPPFTATQIDKREKGTTPMKMDDFYRIARALECAWWDLLPLPPLQQEERALVERYRGLAEPDRAFVKRVADTLAQGDGAPDS